MASRYRQTPIAVIGLACRLPGSCNSPDAFWRFLEDGGIAPLQPPQTRFNLNGHHDGSGRPRTMVSPGGMFIDADPMVVDAGFFGLSQADTIAMDPQQRQLLEVVYEGLESAGVSLESIKGKSFGCFVGSYANDYGDMQARDPEERVLGSTTGLGRAMLSNRISHFLDIKGTSMTIDTACSGSLVSVDVACRYLHVGDIDGAIVASCNLFLGPEHNADTMAMSGAATKTGRCHTFDAKADGYIKSEAVNTVILKRLDDAIAANDPIRAVIRGTASNSDGWTPGIASPSPEAQASAIRQAYANAGISDLSLTGYLEAHGTGTKAGDPIEASGISSVFRDSRTTEEPLLVGSVKSNIGHSEPASGLSGLLKAILAIERAKIPPNPTFITPNPDIDFQSLRLQVPQTLTPWPANTLMRASVNSFGYGGSNAHVIVESADVLSSNTKIQHSTSLRSSGNILVRKNLTKARKHLLTFSANNEKSLQAAIDRLRKHLANPAVSVNLRDLAYTLAAKRSHHFYRAYAVVQNTRLSKAQVFRDKKLPNKPRVGLVFTGQGSQWPQMGKDIIKRVGVANVMIDRLDKALLALSNPPSWTLREYLTQPVDPIQLRRPEFSQPLVTAIQLCQLEALKSWSIDYFGVVGHSSGEIAAACAANFLTPEQAIQIAYLRGVAACQCELPTKSSMMAIGMGVETVQPYLTHYDGRVQIACYNSPKSLTLSGPINDLESLHKTFEENGAFSRLLHVDLGYHSQWISEIGNEYGRLLEHVPVPESFTDFGKTMFSSVTGEVVSHACDAKYWKQNMMSPVLFEQAMSAMISQDVDFLVEVGPSGALRGPVTHLQQSGHFIYLAAAKRNADCFDAILQVAGQLYLKGGCVDLAQVTSDTAEDPPKMIIDLPSYPWDHSKTYWYESEASKDWRFQKFVGHDLLGSKILGTPWKAPWFRKSLKVQDLPWLRDHKISREIVFPAAGYICMAIESIRQVKIATRQLRTEASSPQAHAYRLQDIAFKRAMVLRDGSENKITMSMAPVNDISLLWFHFRIFSLVAEDWQLNCEGLIQIVSMENQGDDLPRPPARLKFATPGRLWYKAMRDSGFHFGPSFQRQLEIECLDGATQSRSLIDLNPPTSVYSQSQYYLHPACLDGCLQAASPSLWLGRRSDIDSVLVPISIDSLTIYPQEDVLSQGVANSSRWYSGRGNRSRPESYKSDIQVVDALTSASVLELSGLGYGQIERNAKAADNMIVSKEVWKPDLTLATTSGLGIYNNYSTSNRSAGACNPMSAPGVGFLGLENGEATCDDARQGVGLRNILSLISHKQPNPSVLEACIFTEPSQSVWLDACGDQELDLSHDSFTLVCQSATNLVEISSQYEQQQQDIKTIIHDLSDSVPLETIVAGSQDLIVVNIESTAYRSLETIMQTCHRLLSAEGFLMLVVHQRNSEDDQILNGSMKSSNEFSVGPFEVVLENVGFRSMITISPDELLPMPTHFVGLTSVGSQQSLLHSIPRSVVLGRLTKTHFPELIRMGLEAFGWSMSQQKIEDIGKPINEPILVFEELYSSILSKVSEDQWQKLQDFLGIQSKVLWVTTGATSGGRTPENSLVLGLGRTARAENPDLKLKVLDLEPRLSPASFSCIDQVLRTFDQSVENEFMERNGVIHISRITPDSSLSLETSRMPQEIQFRQSSTCHRMHCETPGVLDSLTYVEDMEASDDLPEGFVEIEIFAAGVNFKDAVTIMGIVPEDTTRLGLEGAGIIRRVGSKAEPLRVGQRVATYRQGTFANRIQAPKERVHVLPDSMTFEEASTLSCVYGVSIYGLFNLANLKKGQRVLITSAAGGVGIAAIQLCRMVEAEIFATVSSAEKRKYLQTEFGIEDDHMFQSRRVGFRDSIMKMTNGGGCDVVLNSLADELLDESWRCVAANGTLIELGKKDILARNNLSMEPFNRNASFRALDMSHESIPDSVISRLLDQIFEYVEQGHIKPITPRTLFSFNDIPAAIRFIRSGNHIGKVVISDGPQGNPTVSTLPSPPKLKLRQDVSYLIVGGLKGLCGSLALLLARYGARHLVILSRSGYSDEKSQAILSSLNHLGCAAELVQGDVAKVEDVQRTFDTPTLPIDGIIHGAMVLRDKTLSSLSAEDFHAALTPKLMGAWNLHEVSGCAKHPLSFFTMLSSISGVIGQKGQANYAAANVFLDSFAAYRRSQGLTACSIDLGVIEDVGYIAAHQEIAARLDRSTWASGINETRLHRIVSRAILLQLEQQISKSNSNSMPGYSEGSAPCQMITGLGVPQPLSSELLNDPRFRLLRVRATESSFASNPAEGGDDEVSRGLQALTQLKRSVSTKTPPEQSTLLLQPTISVVSLRMAQTMALSEPVEPAKPLASYGMDSLAAVELRNWARQKLEVEISTLEIAEARTLTTLCKDIVDRMVGVQEEEQA